MYVLLIIHKCTYAAHFLQCVITQHCILDCLYKYVCNYFVHFNFYVAFHCVTDYTIIYFHIPLFDISHFSLLYTVLYEYPYTCARTLCECLYFQVELLGCRIWVLSSLLHSNNRIKHLSLKYRFSLSITWAYMKSKRIEQVIHKTDSSHTQDRYCFSIQY